MNEYQPDLFTLEDEDGNEETFELIDVVKEEDTTYYALIPQQSDPDNLEEDDYFVILKQDDNDPDGMLVSIEDESELDLWPRSLYKDFMLTTNTTAETTATVAAKFYY